MASALVRPRILLLPILSAGLSSELRRLRIGSNFLRAPSCSLHTVVATEDPSEERYKHIITSGQHTFKGDLSEAWGAGGTAPEPKDYAFAGLAMCSSMTIRLFADRKKWPLRRITVTVKEIGKDIHGTIPDALQVIVSLEGELTDAQKKRLIEISDPPHNVWGAPQQCISCVDLVPATTFTCQLSDQADDAWEDAGWDFCTPLCLATP